MHWWYRVSPGIVLLAVGCTRKVASPTIKKVEEAKVSVVEVAKRYIGTPYRTGGMDNKGMDCSGLVCTAYKEALNISLPRTADAQAKVGKEVTISAMQPGDLVFFREPGQSRITHVGIVSEVRGKEIRFIHASTSKGVREDSLEDSHWKARYVGARRVASAAAAPADRRGK